MTDEIVILILFILSGGRGVLSALKQRKVCAALLYMGGGGLMTFW